MKLSNKILIGFFTAISLYMITAFTEVRFKGDYNRLDHDNAKVESIPLNAIKYLVVSDLEKRISIRSSDEPRIELRSVAGDMLSILEYDFKEDTLTLKKLNLVEDVHFDFILYIPKKGFGGLDVKDSYVNMMDLDQPSLSLIQSGGRVVMEQNVTIGRLTITASSKAEFDDFDLEVDTVVLEMDDANVELRSRVNRLEGFMVNDSWLSVRGVNDIAFKKDVSSSMRIID